MGPSDLKQTTDPCNQPDSHDPEMLLRCAYEELRRLADGFLRRERSDHTLQATALVHEAWLRLSRQTRVQWQSREHFLGVAALAMRRILVNYAEQRRALRHGGGLERLTLSDFDAPQGSCEVDLLELNEALGRLEQLDPRQCRVVEMRFFGGLSVAETARSLGVSERTVELDWRMARAWLYRQLEN